MDPNQNIDPNSTNKTLNTSAPKFPNQFDQNQDNIQLSPQQQQTPQNNQVQQNPAYQQFPAPAQLNPTQPQPINLPQQNQQLAQQAQPQQAVQQPLQPIQSSPQNQPQPIAQQQPPPSGPINPGLIELNNRKLKKKTIKIISSIGILSLLVGLIFVAAQFVSTIDLGSRESVTENNFSMEIPKGLEKYESSDGIRFMDNEDENLAKITVLVSEEEIDPVDFNSLDSASKQFLIDSQYTVLQEVVSDENIEKEVKTIAKVNKSNFFETEHNDADIAFQYDFEADATDGTKGGGSIRFLYFADEGKFYQIALVGDESIVAGKQDEINQTLDSFRYKGD